MTKLEIEHAERFEALGICQDGRHGWTVCKLCGAIDSQAYNDFNDSGCKSCNNKTEHTTVKLPSCEELWPVILEKFKDNFDFPFIYLDENTFQWKFHYSFFAGPPGCYQLKIVELSKQIDRNDIAGAMREACLTLFEGDVD